MQIKQPKPDASHSPSTFAVRGFGATPSLPQAGRQAGPTVPPLLLLLLLVSRIAISV